MSEEAASAPASGRDDVTPSHMDEHAPRARAAADAPNSVAVRAGERAAASTPAGPDRGARALGWLALGVAAGGVVIGAWAYLNPRVKPPDLSVVQSAVGTANTALREAQGSMQRLDGKVDDTRKQVDALAEAQAAAVQDLDTVRDQTLETAEAMQHLAAGDGATSHGWVRSEAEHLLQSANIALQLNHDPATALAALEAADERLSELADPSVTAARAKLADEIAALRALDQPDIAGIALTLGSLAARVEMLPLAGAEAPAPVSDAPPPNAWQRALGKIGAALSSMVSLHTPSDGGGAILAPEERFFLYRNLELELESARLAVLRGDGANYQQSLASAQRWLQTRFDSEDAGVHSALEALTELEDVRLVTSWPDISGALAELKRAEPQ